MSRIVLTEQQLSKIVKKVLSEADHPFERIAFADQRKELPPGTEPNTPLEDKVFRELYYFVEANEDLSPDSLAAIKDSLKRGLHSDIIYYSQAPAHYRGMHLTAEEIDKHFNIDPEDLPASGKRVFKFPFEFKPRKASGLSSWTSDYSIAEEMALEHSESDEWVVVLVAPSASNPNSFLDLQDMYKALDTWYHYQKECIALGPVMVTEIHIYRPAED